MKKTVLATVAVVAVALLAATSALAANAHFKRGQTPTCYTTVGGANASSYCTGTLTGLGNGDVILTESISGAATYLCVNGGGNAAPGQNKVPIGPGQSSTTIPGNEVKNGNLNFTTNPATITAPSTVAGSAAGCPNGNWSAQFQSLSVTSLSLSATQNGQTIFTCSTSNPNGIPSTYQFAANECA